MKTIKLITLIIIFFNIIIAKCFADSCSECERILSNKTIIATGTYIDKNEALAINIATMMAVNEAAKQVGALIQKENTTLYNDKVHMLIESKAANFIRGYEILEKKYDKTTCKAEVTIKLKGKDVVGLICELLKE